MATRTKQSTPTEGDDEGGDVAVAPGPDAVGPAANAARREADPAPQHEGIPHEDPWTEPEDSLADVTTRIYVAHVERQGFTGDVTGSETVTFRAVPARHLDLSDEKIARTVPRDEMQMVVTEAAAVGLFAVGDVFDAVFTRVGIAYSGGA